MKVQAHKELLTPGIFTQYKNIDLERLLKEYEEKLSDLRGCL
ncbi:hypothetical protein THC_1221 [Caldimicrobium thiodismutans]|jgi:hypothetical protein|uniref:Uncharacterized protein n=1 Tax=Caldimicrobium thiodismutans TaxID=1653476 RepID=A0A0U5AW99_9BACT|nr:hypothetical protein THC_1221 [Caldimicrobium thiodismutans]